MNDSNTVIIRDIANGGLPNHTVNGNNLVIINATNNTNYICVGSTSLGQLGSDPVILYVVGMLYYNVVVIIAFSIPVHGHIKETSPVYVYGS